MNLGAFGNTNQRPRNRRVLSFFTERVNDNAGVGVAVRVPVTLANLQVQREDAVPEDAGGYPIVVHLDRSRRTRPETQGSEQCKGGRDTHSEPWTGGLFQTRLCRARQ